MAHATFLEIFAAIRLLTFGRQRDVRKLDDEKKRCVPRADVKMVTDEASLRTFRQRLGVKIAV